MSVIITSNQPRHKEFARRICESIDIDLVIFEEKSKRPDPSLYEKEKIFFKKSVDWIPSCNFFQVENGLINSKRIKEIIQESSPDVIFVFGSSILKPRIFEIARVGCVNIHTGIVQFLRGVDSTFWAIHDEIPYAIGATVHFIDKGIDTGKIISQTRPELDLKDSVESIFLKVCQSGFDTLCENLDKITSGNTEGYMPEAKGKLYQTSDMSDEAILRVENSYQSTLDSYLKRKDFFDKRFKIIDGKD